MSTCDDFPGDIYRGSTGIASTVQEPHVTCHGPIWMLCGAMDGDDGELTVLFDLADFDKIAKVMRPHRKRQWTEEQKRQASERLAKYQYTPVVDGRFNEHTGVLSTGAV